MGAFRLNYRHKFFFELREDFKSLEQLFIMFDRTFEYQARWVKHPHHVGVRRIKKNLRYLANTFNSHNVVLSEKYPSLVRVCTLPHISDLKSITF